MTELVSSVADKIDRAVQRVTPLAYRVRRTGRRLMRRALRKPRSVSEGPNLLPLLIQVLASFTKADGVLLEEEIDSSLGFLRYDYPEAVYSELRQLFRQALYERQDLAAMAQKLGAQLSTERKIMLGVQLYDLISQAGLKQEQVVAFYSFMSQLGMAAQAIDIVYQLNASEDSDPSIYQRGASPLESLSFGTNGKGDATIGSGHGGIPCLLKYRLQLSARPIRHGNSRALKIGPCVIGAVAVLNGVRPSAQILTPGKVRELFHTDWTVHDRQLAAALGFAARYDLTKEVGFYAAAYLPQILAIRSSTLS